MYCIHLNHDERRKELTNEILCKILEQAVHHSSLRPQVHSHCIPAFRYIAREAYAFELYIMLLAAITFIIPTINILLMLNPIIDPALAEAVGTPWLPDGESTPTVVAGGRADGSTDVAGDLAILEAVGVGDELAVRGGLETGVPSGAPAPAVDKHWVREPVVILQAPGRVRA